MCVGSEFQVDGAETENAREVKLLVMPVGLARRFGRLDVWTCVQLEKTNEARVCRLVEHVVSLKTRSDSFRLFLDALDDRYASLVRDLQADLRVERGDVKPLPELLHETAALVHRSRLTVSHLEVGLAFGTIIRGVAPSASRLPIPYTRCNLRHMLNLVIEV